MTIAVERAESRASEQRAGWAVREASLTEQCLSLKRELEGVQVGNEGVWPEHGSGRKRMPRPGPAVLHFEYEHCNYLLKLGHVCPCSIEPIRMNRSMQQHWTGRSRELGRMRCAGHALSWI